MLLFFRLLLYFILFIIIVFLVLIFSKFKIIIDVLEYNTENINKKLVYKGKVALYFLGKIKIFSKKFNSQENNHIISKKYANKRIELLKKNCNYGITGQTKKIKKIVNILISNIIIERFETHIVLDTENASVTSYLVASISAVIPCLIKKHIRKYKSKLFNWKVLPRYQNSNYISLKLNCIISIKIVHIINMFKLIGGMKNEGTSNRKLNADCYGKY